MTAVLAIATATGRVGVAIESPQGTGSVSVAAGRRHGETLAPAIQAVMSLTGVAMPDLSLVAVDAGPGLFTGLRVGVATAKALASALRLPVAVGSSLDLLAARLAHTGRTVVSVVDARRAEVFWAAFGPAAAGPRPLTEPTVMAPEKLAAELTNFDRPLLVGDGARRYHDVLGGELAPAEFDHPSATVLAGVAPRLPTVPPEQVGAVYLRGADVRIGWETR